jgi:hypothetical protein
MLPPRDFDFLVLAKAGLTKRNVTLRTNEVTVLKLIYILRGLLAGDAEKYNLNDTRDFVKFQLGYC